MTCPDCEQARAERDAANRQLARLVKVNEELAKALRWLVDNASVHASAALPADVLRTLTDTAGGGDAA